MYALDKFDDGDNAIVVIIPRNRICVYKIGSRIVAMNLFRSEFSTAQICAAIRQADDVARRRQAEDASDIPKDHRRASCTAREHGQLPRGLRRGNDEQEYRRRSRILHTAAVLPSAGRSLRRGHRHHPDNLTLVPALHGGISGRASITLKDHSFL